MKSKALIKNLSVKLKVHEHECLIERFKRYVEVTGEEISLHAYCRLVLMSGFV